MKRATTVVPVRHDQNARTQPHRTLPVFNNWDVVAKGWYFACRSDELAPEKALPFELYGQRLVLFRGADGQVRALDAFCPHMGTDLAIGKVVGNTLRCFFHHWRFDGEGQCVDVPCLSDKSQLPKQAKLQSYATCERYGAVWVWPDHTAPEPVTEFDGLAGAELEVWFDEPIERSCHHHVCMINGLDPQHLATVHDIEVEMSVAELEHANGRVMDFVLEGAVPSSIMGHALRAFIGERYRYGMRYADGCLGLLTTMKGLSLGGTGPRLPELYMLYAYTPLARGRIRVQAIFVTKKRAGVLGKLWSRALLFTTKLGYRALQGEDGEVYDNMRFSPRALLPIDAPVARFMSYVNRLEPSVWSQRVRDDLAGE
jgi:nitrite reductase/ring-hydroxylating ferredoxin subunit